MLKKRPITLLLLILGFGIFYLSAPAYADVTCSCLGNDMILEGDQAVLDPDFEGTVIITMPDGDILLLESGDEIPEIPSGSVMEIFDGQMTVQGTNGFKLSCGSEVGEIVAMLGAVKVIGENGETTLLQAGQSLKLSLTGPPVPAAPTAASETLGTSVRGSTEPDSRNIAQSPSQ